MYFWLNHKEWLHTEENPMIDHDIVFLSSTIAISKQWGQILCPWFVGYSRQPCAWVNYIPQSGTMHLASGLKEFFKTRLGIQVRRRYAEGRQGYGDIDKLSNFQ
jgi:hypothetical protein